MLTRHTYGNLGSLVIVLTNNPDLMSKSTTDNSAKILKYFPEYANDQTTFDELVSYANDLDIVADADVSIQFNNKGRDHAILVMSKIFSRSHRSIKIFARDFNGEISDNPLYLESLKSFLERDSDNSVQVIFEKEPNAKSKALQLLRMRKQTSPKQISLMRATQGQLGEFRSFLVNKGGMINFTIGANKNGELNMYRCETDTENYVAILNFDDPKFTNALNRLYGILEKDAEEI